MNTYRNVIVEGPIAAGKTTFSIELGKALGPNTLVLTEPDEKGGRNPYLAKYYEDPKRYSYTMQTHLLGTRFEMQKLAQTWVISGQGDAVMDRSYYFDTSFARIQANRDYMQKDEYETYCMLFRSMTEFVHFPAFCIWLKVEPEICNSRIAKRMLLETGRKCEEAIPLDYLRELNNEISVTMKALKSHGTKIIELDWNGNKETPEERRGTIETMVRQIRESKIDDPFLDIYGRLT